MSSTTSNSDIKNLKREFIFTWSIHNYSYCTKKWKEDLVSPEFVVEFLDNRKLRLGVYPKGSHYPDFVSVFLYGSYLSADCNFTFSFRIANGQFQEENTFPRFIPPDYNGYPQFLGLKEIDGSYVVDDTLTVRCRIWKAVADIPASIMNLSVHSRIIVSKLNYTWILNDIEVSNDALITFNQNKEIKDFFVNISSLKIHLLNEENSGKNFMHFGIEIVKSTKNVNFFICVIHLLDKNGQVAHSARGEHLFDNSEAGDIWNFPIISKDKLNFNKNVYVHEGKLTIQCEISFSSENELETFEYGRTDMEKKADLIERSPDVQDLWVGSMHECLSEGKFSDFIIHTPEKQFPVHKAILSAHSEVFSAMFERDMAESNSSLVVIEDLSEDTVCQMLTFLYTNTIKDLNCTSAQELYFAADKYQIKTLLKKCSNHLACGFDCVNACDILALADRHHDQELKSRARDFIEANAHEIIMSERWKKLMATNPHLTADVLQSIVCNKLL